MQSSFERHLKSWKSYESILDSTDRSSSESADLSFASTVLDAIDAALRVLDEDERSLVVSFYHDRKKIDQICLEQGYSRTQYYRFRKNAFLKMEIFAYLMPLEQI